jgi:hypothetical protein
MRVKQLFCSELSRIQAISGKRRVDLQNCCIAGPMQQSWPLSRGPVSVRIVYRTTIVD